MSELLFLSNELLHTGVAREWNFPLQFVRFAIWEGNLYTTHGNKHTFNYIPSGSQWGNDVVYGGLFLLEEFHFYIRALDAYHTCSMSTLGRNHDYDTEHRIRTHVIPIQFNDEDEFVRLLYQEREPIQAITYVGNPKHPNIQKRATRRHRIVQGLHPLFKDKLREEMNENSRIRERL